MCPNAFQCCAQTRWGGVLYKLLGDGDIPQGELTIILIVVITMRMVHWKSFMVTNQPAKNFSTSNYVFLL